MTYDVYNGRGWDQTPGRERQVDSEAADLPGRHLRGADRRATPSRTRPSRSRSSSPPGGTSYSAGYPIKTFVPVLVVESGDQPFLGALKATAPVDAGRSYSMTVR